MKFTKEMQDRIIAWVELNGLYPQPCGATVRSLCEFGGFSDTTFDRWMNDPKNVDFVARLNRAREKFSSTLVLELENALVRAAKGAEVRHIKEKAKAERIEIVHADGTKEIRLGELKTVDAQRTTYTQAPDVKALQFVLTNLAPDKWKVKQEHTLEATGCELKLSLPQEAIDGLEHAIATGAMPRPPKDEEEG